MGTEVDDDLLTVDELAAATGMTVRTTRYYSSLGLLPPPERRGRMAFYSTAHRARLELIGALQAHGFTLAAIEKYLARVPFDASVEELAIQRAMMTSWSGGEPELLTRAQLDERAGRALSELDIAHLEAFFAVRREGDRFAVLAPFEVALKSLSIDLPIDSMLDASRVIGRHMESLADELTAMLRRQVLVPFREQPHTTDDAARFEETMSQLRQLTLEAVVAGFQRAADQVITRSFSREEPPSPDVHKSV